MMSKVYNPALQERLESYLANSGISQAKLAPKVGISQTALSQYRRSKYDNGDIVGNPYLSGEIERASTSARNHIP